MHNIWPTKRNTSARNVCVGLSGGVDSAVSAALLQQEGYEVTGVFIKIVVEGYPCIAAEDRIDAMRVAAHLRIPFVEIDLSKEYRQKVFELSVQEFAQGRTPNPDVLCNREIKFGLFAQWAFARDADYIATGHYCRLRKSSFASPVELLTGIDPDKDQSYFLWAVPQEVLARTLFPVGGFYKAQVRALAKKFELPNAERKDSQGLCFLGPISLTHMLERELGPKPGLVLDEEGKEVGVHKGAVLYTLGERHGFTLHTHTPESTPHFVVAKDTKHNTITVSSERFPRGARRIEVVLQDPNWIGEVGTRGVQARYRYRQQLIAGTLDMSRATVVLGEPHYVPEGQSLVLYRGERCLGGGVVKKSSTII